MRTETFVSPQWRATSVVEPPPSRFIAVSRAGVGEQLRDLDGRHAERLRLAAVGDEQQQRSAAVLEADRGARVDRAVAGDDLAVADQHLVAADGELELLGDVAAERVVER